MTGFLERLAAMALGEMPASSAFASLPPRFGPVSATAWISEAENGNGRRQPQVIPDTPARAPAPSSSDNSYEHEIGSAVTTGVAATYDAAPIANTARTAVAPAPSRPIKAEAGAPDTRPSITGGLATEASRFTSAVTDATRKPTQGVIRDPILPVPRTATTELRPSPGAWESVARKTEPMRPPQPLPVAGPEPRSAPLSEAAVATRPRAVRPQPPVVHVTIDRIDVRAPSSPRAAQQPSRKPVQPSVSLSDYLRGSGHGGRA